MAVINPSVVFITLIATVFRTVIRNCLSANRNLNQRKPTHSWLKNFLAALKFWNAMVQPQRGTYVKSITYSIKGKVIKKIWRWCLIFRRKFFSLDIAIAGIISPMHYHVKWRRLPASTILNNLTPVFDALLNHWCHILLVCTDVVGNFHFPYVSIPQAVKVGGRCKN